MDFADEMRYYLHEGTPQERELWKAGIAPADIPRVLKVLEDADISVYHYVIAIQGVGLPRLFTPEEMLEES